MLGAYGCLAIHFSLHAYNVAMHTRSLIMVLHPFFNNPTCLVSNQDSNSVHPVHFGLVSLALSLALGLTIVLVSNVLRKETPLWGGVVKKPILGWGGAGEAGTGRAGQGESHTLGINCRGVWGASPHGGGVNSLAKGAVRLGDRVAQHGQYAGFASGAAKPVVADDVGGSNGVCFGVRCAPDEGLARD